MPLLTSILLLLVLSRLLGELVHRLHQPAIIGEILAGVLLGPAVFNLIHATEPMAGIAELSVFLIVMSAGLEMELSDVTRAFAGRGLVVALLGFLIPLLSGVALGMAFRMDAMRTIFLGLCMAITALPVAVRILENFKMLGSNIARFSIATAVLNDVAALLFLGVILDKPIEGGLIEVGISVLRTGGKLFLLAAFIFIASRLLQWGGSKTRYIEHGLEKVIGIFGREALFGISVLFVLIFGSISETLGSHFVIGAFFGGLLLSTEVFGVPLFGELKNTIHSITSGFLAPIFFAFLGLHFSFDSFKSPIFLLSVLAVAFISKVYAGIIGGRLTGMSRTDALGIGIMLNGRGVMELVVANIALQRGFISEALFSILVLMGIVTTLLTPILFKRFVLPSIKTRAA